MILYPVTDDQIMAAAESDAEFDGRPFSGLGRHDRERYLARARQSLSRAAATGPSQAAIASIRATLEKSRDLMANELSTTPTFTSKLDEALQPIPGAVEPESIGEIKLLQDTITEIETTLALLDAA